MSNPIELTTIRENIVKIADENGIKITDIFLFGSRTKDKYTELSDYDLLIILKDDLEEHTIREIRKKIYHRVHSLLPKASFDVIVKTEKQFEREKEIVNTISNEVLLEGMRI